MRHISDRGLELIKEFEGLSFVEYKDVAGYPTIGYGHLMKSGESYPDGITEEKAAELLRDDLAEAEEGVTRQITVDLNDNQFAALVSFTFNLGEGNLKSSTLRKKLNSGDYDGAADEFPKWCYAGGKPFKGLLNRRNKERALFLEVE